MFKKIFFSLAIILLIFVFSGCSRGLAPSGAQKENNIKPSGAVKNKNLSDADLGRNSVDDGDPGDDLLDLYVRIYGRDAVSERDGVPVVNLDRIYGKLKKINRAQVEEHYKNLYIKAQALEKDGLVDNAASAYGECVYVEEEIFKKPGLGKIALERIKKETLEKADEFYKKCDYKEALRYAEIAVYCDPSDFDSLKLAGELFSLTGEEGLSISYFSAALHIKPGDTALKYKLKTMYLLEGRPEGAIPLITQDISPYTRMKSHWVDLAEAYFMLSAMHPRNRDYRKKTESALDKALNDGRISNLGKAEMHFSRSLFQDNFTAALDDLDGMSKLNLESALVTRIMYDKGLIYLLMGRRALAAEIFEKIIGRVSEQPGVTQGENYMALMSAWALDVMGKRNMTSRDAGRIFSRLKDPDHSYRQEFGYIKEYLEAREKGKWNEAAGALVKLTKKRHLEPVGDFAQDILQIPAEKGLVYISLGRMYEKAGKKRDAWECFEKVKGNRFFGHLILGR
jgi:tetratricopeptide (TPR) repeat protein